MTNKTCNSNAAVKSPILKVLNYTLLIVCTILVIMPLYLIFTIAFKSNQEYMYSGVLELPKSFMYFENFRIAFTQGEILLGYKNTLILIIASVTVSIIFNLMLAYALGRFEFKFKKLMVNVVLISTIIPSITTQVATFTVVKSLHLYNTIFAGMVLYIGSDVVLIYMFLQFIRSLPYSLDESALIDGASYFRIFRSIIVPLMKPAIATAVILKTLGIYNDMFTQYLYMPKNELRTVTTSIMKFSYDKSASWNIMAAAIVLILVPPLILYLFLQKYMVSGLSSGAVKM